MNFSRSVAETEELFLSFILFILSVSLIAFWTITHKKRSRGLPKKAIGFPVLYVLSSVWSGFYSLFEPGRIRVYVLFYVSAHRWLLVGCIILVSGADLLTQARKCIRALTHTHIYDCFGSYVCYCTYKSSPMAFNDDPSRKSPAISISGSFGFRWVAFECALMPAAAATEIHRSERKTGFIEISNRSS